MPSITATGVSIESFNDLFDSIATEYKAIYGEDINIDQDTSDGQKISIFVKAYRDMQEMGLDLYNSFDPDTATGTQLHKLIKLCGISRTPATKSSVTIEMVVSQDVTLDSDYTLKDSLGQLWVISESQTLSSGTHNITFYADEWGAITVLADTITEFETIVLGVDSVTNPSAATVGINEETDNDLKIRRYKSVYKPSSNTVQGMTGKILNINEVTDCKVYENNTNSIDSDSIPAHGMWIVVDGGTESDIHEVIASDRGSGIPLKGTITDTVEKTLTRSDGSIITLESESAFDRPAETELYITFDVAKKSTSTTLDLDSIKSAIVNNAKLYIDDNAYVTELYSYIYQAGTNFTATNLQISRDDITYVSDVITSNTAEKFIFTSANITITEI